MLSGVETQKEKILHVILAGQPELNQKLEAPDMEQLLQRVSLRYHVRALSLDETREYVEHRLKIAGCDKKLFMDDLYPSIHEYTGGIPRLINTLCDTVLTCGYADNKLIIDQTELATALKELQWKKYTDSHRDQRTSAYLEQDDLYDANSIHKEPISPADARDMLQGAYSPIASRALVEISRQLKRIADNIESNNKPPTKKKS
jgi:hypothetical protein